MSGKITEKERKLAIELGRIEFMRRKFRLLFKKYREDNDNGSK